MEFEERLRKEHERTLQLAKKFPLINDLVEAYGDCEDGFISIQTRFTDSLIVEVNEYYKETGIRVHAKTVDLEDRGKPYYNQEEADIAERIKDIEDGHCFAAFYTHQEMGKRLLEACEKDQFRKEKAEKMDQGQPCYLNDHDFCHMTKVIASDNFQKKLAESVKEKRKWGEVSNTETRKHSRFTPEDVSKDDKKF